MPASAFGIDLGTTFSVIAYLDEQGLPRVIPNAEGEPTTPSVIHLSDDGPVVGSEAKHRQSLGEANVVSFIKREIGKSDYLLETTGEVWTPVRLSALILEKLKRDAETHLRHPVTQAVITVPAYFDNPRREATIEAGRLAGLEVLQVINEPTAAALAYGLRTGTKDELILVFDLGGGTFDVSLLQLTAEEFKVLGTDGDHELGGKDWDDTIARWFVDGFQQAHGLNLFEDQAAYDELLVLSEQVKRKLSDLGSARLKQLYCSVNHADELSRSRFEELSQPLMSRTENLCRKVLAGQKKEWSDLTGTLLVGGSSRMPMVRTMLERLAGRPPLQSVNPDFAVAEGAAIWAGQILANRSPNSTQRFYLPGNRLRLTDVMSHSLGMIAESQDGSRYINSILIPKNQPIPCVEVKPFDAMTRPAGPNELEVYTTQGEADDPLTCTILNKHRVVGITHGSQGTTAVNISYSYDASGLVTVTAAERDSARLLEVVRESVPDNMSWLSEPPRRTGPGGVKAYLAVDLSGSMSGTPLQKAQEAAHEFLRQIDLSKCELGLIVFSDRNEMAIAACRNASEIETAINQMRVGRTGYCNMASPFAYVQPHLLQHNGPRFLILLTDGVWDRPPQAIQEADECRASGIQTIAIGFGGADQGFLKRVATTESAGFYTSLNDLVGTFSTIAREISETAGGQSTAGAASPRFLSARK